MDGVKRRSGAVSTFLGLLVLVSLALLDRVTSHGGVTFANGLVIAGLGWFLGRTAALVGTLATVAFAAANPGANPGEKVLAALTWLAFGLCAATLRKRMGEVECQRQELDQAASLLRRDLEAARLVQKALLDRALPRHPNLRMAVRFTAARGPSGDFYDVTLQEDHLALCVADVSGKGAPAALVTGLLRGLLLEISHRVEEPAGVMAELHARLVPYLPFDMFVTCFYAVLDLTSGTVRFANAGHDPPLLWHPSGGPVDVLEGTGYPLGVVEGQEFAQGQRELKRNDLLLVYTDGLVNSRVPGGERLGDRALEAAVTRGWGSPETILRHLETLLPRRDQEGPEDDILLLALQWLGRPIGTTPSEGRPSLRARPVRTSRRRGCRRP